MAHKKYILALESLDGEDCTIYLEADGVSTDSLFCIISVGPDGAGIIDSGYRSLSEARAAWPEAVVPRAAKLLPGVRKASFTIDVESDTRLASVLRQGWKREI